MGLTISALTGIQYLGKQVEIIQSDENDDMVMYEGEPTTNFIKVEDAGYPTHAGVLVDGGYYYHDDEMHIEIGCSNYGEFIDCVVDFFKKKETPNTLINLTDFTDCQGFISNKMCRNICGSIYYAVLVDGFRCPEKNAKFLLELVNIFQKAALQNGIVVYW